MPKRSRKDFEVTVHASPTQDVMFEGDNNHGLREGVMTKVDGLGLNLSLGDPTSDYQDQPYDEGTFSLSSSVYHYRLENGRLYHAYRDGAYSVPCDEIELDRLDLMHCVYLHLLDGKLHLAPIVGQPKRVLDVGTGTGIWAIDFADQNPKSQVTGIDLSPTQSNLVPPNCRFELEDAESEWTWDPNYFDFIHSRHLASGIRNWDGYLAQLYRFTVPGGYINLSEYEYDLVSDDNSYHPGLLCHRLLSLVRVSLPILGYTDVARSLGRRVREAGFVDVKVHEMKMPWGAWSDDEKLKTIGNYTQNLLSEETFQALCVGVLARSGLMGGAEATKMCADAVREVRDPSVGLHAYNIQFIVTARKPE